MPELVSEALSSFRIKRESGANPEQSRCCEAPLEFSEIIPHTTEQIGKVFGKRSQSEDLPFIKMLLLTRGIRKAVKNIIEPA